MDISRPTNHHAREATISRKVFLLQIAGGGFMLALGGCGGGGGDAAPAPPPAPAPAPSQATNCSPFTFTANHGHVLAIPIADLDSTVARTYSTGGTAPHNHSVTLSPTQLAQLKAGQAVQLTTSVAGLDPHTHDLGGTCA